MLERSYLLQPSPNAVPTQNNMAHHLEASITRWWGLCRMRVGQLSGAILRFEGQERRERCDREGRALRDLQRVTRPVGRIRIQRIGTVGQIQYRPPFTEPLPVMVGALLWVQSHRQIFVIIVQFERTFLGWQ